MPVTKPKAPQSARSTSKKHVGVPAPVRLFAKNYDTALKRAEEDFDRAEDTGTWAHWSDGDGIAPWWVAGAIYILEIQRGRTFDYLTAGYSEDLIHALGEKLTQAETFALWHRRFRPYEYPVTKDRTERLRRRNAFVDYVDLLVREKLTALLLSPETGSAPGTAPASLDAESCGQAANWECIEITFLNDERVQIRKGTNIETRNYKEFWGPQDRDGSPNPSWQLLRFMAKKGGVISRDALRWTPKRVQQTVQAMRKLLQLHFDLTADPLPLIKGTGYAGYRARFKIGYASSFNP